MSTNNTNTFTPPSNTAANDRELTSTSKLSTGSIIGIVVGAVVGAALVGTVTAAVLAVVLAKKKTSSQITGTCNTGQINYNVWSCANTTGEPPNFVGNDSSMCIITCDNNVANTCSDPTPGFDFPGTYPTEQGLFIMTVRNYINQSSTSCENFSDIGFDGYFVPNSGFLAWMQAWFILYQIEIMKPALAIVCVYGDASKILTNTMIIDVMKKLGSTLLTSNTSYVLGSPYYLVYQKDSQLPATPENMGVASATGSCLEVIGTIQNP